MTDTPWEPPLNGTEPEHLVGALDRLRPDELYALWDGAVTRSRVRLEAALTTGGLDQEVHISDDDGRHASLRRLVCDLLEEYGRHTGQADQLREAVDGLVGEDPTTRLAPLTSRWPDRTDHPHSPATSPPSRTTKPLTTTMKKIRTNLAPCATAVRAPM
jgi:hypothetical protein